jgi:hypothetical protein
MSEVIDQEKDAKLQDLQLELQRVLQTALMQFNEDHAETLAELQPSIHEVVWAMGSSAMSFVYEQVSPELLTEDVLVSCIETLAGGFADKFEFLKTNYPR